MLKREHIKQAIDAISSRDPDVGYALDEMLSMGRIAPVSVDHYPPGRLSGEDFYFRFDEHPATVKRSLFFSTGTVPIEERLLIKYGEMRKKQQLLREGHITDFQQAVSEIRTAGLRFMVSHELDRGLALLRAQPAIADGHRASADGIRYALARRHQVAALLGTLRKDHRNLAACCPDSAADDANDISYRGSVDADISALFVRFPFCMEALIQVADINVDFFHVRFLISCLINGLEHNLFACVAGDRIEGLVYLTEKSAPFYHALEIHYIATVRGRPADETKMALRSLKGVGTFLMAGVWMLWKEHRTAYKDILLDSEIGARGFYAASGFASRGISGFVLREPKGRLAAAILEMAGRSRRVGPRGIEAACRIIETQVKRLRSRSKKLETERAHAVAALEACLDAGAMPVLSEAAVRLLVRYRRKIPEADRLIRFSIDHGSPATRAALDFLLPDQHGGR